MNAKNSKPTSRYAEYLPSLLQGDRFLLQFLLAFEKVLSGFENETGSAQIIKPDEDIPPGIELILDQIHDYFDPQKTPEEFLPWLAGWVGLSLRDDWDVRVKRSFIQQIVSLYQLRGTKTGLEKLLALYLKNAGFGDKVEVFDQFAQLPNYFQVQLTLPDRDPEKYWRQARIAKAIIDQEKPAHTFYTLKILVPTMQLTRRSRCLYGFTLLDAPETQIFELVITIIPDPDTTISLEKLAKEFKIAVANSQQTLKFLLTPTLVQNNSIQTICNISYAQFLDCLNGLQISLSNQSDRPFNGSLNATVNFQLNQKKVSNPILSQPLKLNPVLEICIPNAQKTQPTSGNTIIYNNNQQKGMRITQEIWSSLPPIYLLDPPDEQEFLLEAKMVIDTPKTVSDNIIYQLNLYLQDAYLQGHLLIPKTTTTRNSILVRKTLNHRQLLDNLEGLKVGLKNLNRLEIQGKLTVDLTFIMNHQTVTHHLVNENLVLTALGEYDTLQICRRDANGKITLGNTIIGTTSQSISRS